MFCFIKKCSETAVQQKKNTHTQNYPWQHDEGMKTKEGKKTERNKAKTKQKAVKTILQRFADE